MSFRLVQELAADGVHVAVACRVLRVSSSGYYEWRERGPSARARADEVLSAEIAEIHTMSRGTYGSPRVHAELRLGRDVRCGRKRVARLMRTAGLQGAFRRRGRRRYPAPPVHDDLVQRRFLRRTGSGSPTSPNTRRARARSTWRRCSTCTPGASSAGRSPTTCARSSSSTRWRWHAGGAGRLAARPWCTQTAGASTRPGRSAVACARPGCSARSLRANDNNRQAHFSPWSRSSGRYSLLDRCRWQTRAELATAIFEWIEGWYNPRRRHSSVADLRLTVTDAA